MDDQEISHKAVMAFDLNQARQVASGHAKKFIPGGATAGALVQRWSCQ